jgi:release factor glutamine methyltransferase
LANPPYVPVGTALEPEVAQHDPSHAVFGGIDGMAVIGPLVANAARWLKPGGLLAVEHDDATGDATVGIVVQAGVFDRVTAHRDLTDRPRFVTARSAPSAEDATR